MRENTIACESARHAFSLPSLFSSQRVNPLPPSPPRPVHLGSRVFPRSLVQEYTPYTPSHSLIPFSSQIVRVHSRSSGPSFILANWVSLGPTTQPALAATPKPNPPQQRPSRSLPSTFLSYPIAHHDPVLTAWVGREGHSET
jgi:hypothetical protein